MRCAILTLAAAIAATSAVATCSPNPENPVPAFETAKQALLDGDYELFLKTTLPLNDDPMAEYETVMGPLAQALPDGMQSCETAVMRRDDPAYAQEIVMFSTGVDLIVLYMEAALFGGEMTILSMQYSQSPKEIFQRLN